MKFQPAKQALPERPSKRSAQPPKRPPSLKSRKKSSEGGLFNFDPNNLN